MLPAARIRAPVCSPRAIAIANPRQRQQRAVTVADGGDAVTQVDLRRLEHDLVLARLVLRHRLVAIVLPAVERQVNVGVDHPRHQPAAARVDLRARRRESSPLPRGRRR